MGLGFSSGQKRAGDLGTNSSGVALNAGGSLGFGGGGATFNGAGNGLTSGSVGLPAGTSFPAPTVVTSEQVNSDLSSAFGTPTPINPNDVLQKFQPVPTVNAPTVDRTKIDIPGGSFDAYQKALYASQFDPVSRELDRQKAVRAEELKGQLAAAGLAESGAGVGQEVKMGEEYSQRQEAASRDISQSAAAQRGGLEISTATNQAQLDQQKNLANAGFSLEAQKTNAANILTGNTAKADAYLKALGLNVEQATAYRNSFVNLFTAEQQAALGRDKLRQDAMATVLDAQLKRMAMLQQQQQAERAAAGTEPSQGQAYAPGSYGSGLYNPQEVTHNVHKPVSTIGPA